ncbi:hypothetical protein F0726_00131 [Acidithiobacillus caldus]|nr:hypothetical protein F0726_00131 [Acidithiobacillus caldus]
METKAVPGLVLSTLEAVANQDPPPVLAEGIH